MLAGDKLHTRKLVKSQSYLCIHYVLTLWLEMSMGVEETFLEKEAPCKDF
jgi:hypothetical protein